VRTIRVCSARSLGLCTVEGLLHSYKHRWLLFVEHLTVIVYDSGAGKITSLCVLHFKTFVLVVICSCRFLSRMLASFRIETSSACANRPFSRASCRRECRQSAAAASGTAAATWTRSGRGRQPLARDEADDPADYIQSQLDRQAAVVKVGSQRCATPAACRCLQSFSVQSCSIFL
jgi:hypothetical protein